MQMLHFRVPTSCNGMRLNIFLRTMGVSSACIKAVKYQGTGFCVRLGDEVIPFRGVRVAFTSAYLLHTPA